MASTKRKIFKKPKWLKKPKWKRFESAPANIALVSAVTLAIMVAATIGMSWMVENGDSYYNPNDTPFKNQHCVRDDIHATVGKDGSLHIVDGRSPLQI